MALSRIVPTSTTGPSDNCLRPWKGTPACNAGRLRHDLRLTRRAGPLSPLVWLLAAWLVVPQVWTASAGQPSSRLTGGPRTSESAWRIITWKQLERGRSGTGGHN